MPKPAATKYKPQQVRTPQQEQAWRAAKKFRALKPGLQGLCRAITGDKKLQIKINTQDTRVYTDGRDIVLPVPYDLGADLRHDVSVCGIRMEGTDEQLCQACAVHEDLMVKIYHEMAHIVFGSFKKPSHDDVMRTIQDGVDRYKTKIARTAARIIESGKSTTDTVESYLELAELISPYMPLLVNAIEDARVNTEMFAQRPGLRIIFRAWTKHLFEQGVKAPDGTIIGWREAPLNSQITVAVLERAMGYEIDDWFSAKIEEDLNDPQLNELIAQIGGTYSTRDVYKLAFPIYDRLREMGYLITPEEQDDEPSLEMAEDRHEKQESQEQENQDEEEEAGSDSSDDSGGDSGDGESGSTEGLPEDSDSSQESESGDSSGGSGGGSPADDDASDGGSGDARSEPCDSGSGADADQSGGDSESGTGSGSNEQTSGDGANESGSGATESSAGDSATSSGADDSSGPGQPVSEDEGQPVSEDGTATGARGTGNISAEPDPNAESSSQSGSAGSGQSEGVPDRDEHGSDPGSESDPGQGSSDSGAGEADSSDDSDDQSADPDAGDGRGEGTVSDDAGQSPDASADGDEGRSDGESGPRSDTDPSDGLDECPTEDNGASGSEEGLLEESLDDEEELAEARAIRIEQWVARGTVEAVKQALEQFGGHKDIDGNEPESPFAIAAAGFEAMRATLSAVNQAEYFETPSVDIMGVKIRTRRDQETGDAWNRLDMEASYGYEGERLRARGVRAGIIVEETIPENVLGRALLRTRLVFEHNAQKAFERNLKSGRIDPKKLARRAPINDERLFQKARRPGKRDYHVLIGIDISGSTIGKNVKLAKLAALGQAELCNRTGVKFEIWAHTNTYDYSMGGEVLDMYQIKTVDDPWDSATKDNLMTLSGMQGNLDGHALEFMRKRMDTSTATDKIILYYSDGKMPASNYEEELAILQDNIEICRQRKIHLLGVGIRSDSPIEHGLDTVLVEDITDLEKVVRHLEKVLR